MVSSTVPRFEDRWPPVEATESTMKARSSFATCERLLRSSPRSDAGSSRVSSRGYELMRGAIFHARRSTTTIHDEGGDLVEAPGPAAERLQRIPGVAQQFPSETACFGESHEARVGRLVRGLVLARGLAEGFRVALLVEDVVDHLKSEAYALRVAIEAFALGSGKRRAAARAHDDRCANERAGLED